MTLSNPVKSMLRQFAVNRRLPHIRGLLKKLRPRSSGHGLLRFGPQSDGGYLLPDDLNGIIACFSPGVCETSGFELDCASWGMPVYMADASVSGPAGSSPLFHFTRKFVGAECRGDFITLQRWVDESLHDRRGDLLLQMDIEGYEYEVLNSLDDSLLRRFRIVIVEFHNLRTILNGRSAGWNGIRGAMDRLLANHTCVHAHPNNTAVAEKVGDIEIPDLMELTFLRTDRSTSWQDYGSFPHPLDRDNDPRLPSMVLPPCWY